MSYRVLVCGGRDYANKSEVFRRLDTLRDELGDLHIIQGGASGADSLAFDWARDRAQDVTTVWADWTKHGKPAGPIRNSKMIAAHFPELVVAFPGGSGTADMVRKARAARIEVVEVQP